MASLFYAPWLTSTGSRFQSKGTEYFAAAQDATGTEPGAVGVALRVYWTTLMRCPACQSEVPNAQRFCGSCGSQLVVPSQMPTEREQSPSPLRAAPSEPGVAARILHRDALPGAGFTPGTVLGRRYRIIGLLGRGGMGEVYRADDLKLGTPVALKFLPRALAQDPDRRERLLDEVRIARQVTHPNVCRLYDVAELDGQHFLSMEYIDGEDLDALLKRIGRLPGEKALDIARQVCAGLAAAHNRGVLHRDL